MFELMITCDKPDCEIEWYQHICMSTNRAPKGSWICRKYKRHSIKYDGI